MVRKTLRIAAIAVAAAVALTAAGCSSNSSSDSSSNEKVTLTYWGGTNTDKAIAVWNKSHPNIQVKVQIVQGGDPLLTKLLTAIKAGSGAPDVVGMDYTTIPTLVSDNAVQDLSELGASDLKSEFPASYWNNVTLGTDAVYGIPEDAGPMMFYYRKDVFAKLGLSAPTTWDEYAADAAKIHAADPNQYIGTASAGDPSWFAGLVQQAGGSWWSTSGKSWSVNIDSAASKKVASFWGKLVQEGLVDTQAMFTPGWNAAIANGEQVGWTSSVWGPGVLAGVAAGTEGDWAAAPLPTWGDGSANGNWGGGATVVTSQSKHPQQAMEFIKWLSTSKQGLTSMVQNVGIYPAANDKQGTLDTPPAFLSDQTDFYSIAAQAEKGVKSVTYGPNVNVAFNAYTDAVGTALQAKTEDQFLAALETIQNTTVADMKKSGFTVK